MENWLEKAHKKYLGYDPNVWVRDFFDPMTGGYVVVNRKRIANADKSKNEREKFEDEFAVTKVFAQSGCAMEMLKEISGVSSPDVTINGIPAEIKRVDSAANIERYARKATRRQGARLVLFKLDKRALEVKRRLKVLSKKGIHGKYYIDGEGKIYDF